MLHTILLISDLFSTSVDGLKKDGDYEFRVRAKNIAGLGAPSDETGSVICKPKYSEYGLRGGYWFASKGTSSAALMSLQSIKLDLDCLDQQRIVLSMLRLVSITACRLQKSACSGLFYLPMQRRLV